tara:strand:+ start:249 stop:467 length:219 start_codon:yes stop_codon:yes gene_type:complete
MSKNKQQKIITNYIIKLSQPDDIAFSNIAQNAIVTGATLPSGFKVPAEGNWVVKNDFIVDKETLLKLGFKEV